MLPYGSSTTSYQPNTQDTKKRFAYCRPFLSCFFSICTTNHENIFVKICQIVSLKKISLLTFNVLYFYPLGNLILLYFSKLHYFKNILYFGELLFCLFHCGKKYLFFLCGNLCILLFFGVPIL